MFLLVLIMAENRPAVVPGGSGGGSGSGRLCWLVFLLVLIMAENRPAGRIALGSGALVQSGLREANGSVPLQFWSQRAK